MTIPLKISNKVSRNASHIHVKSQPDYHINIDSFLNIPANVYWKNCEGVHLGCNDYTAESTGLSSRHEYCGATIFDISEKKVADVIHQNDQLVVGNKTGSCIIENSGALFAPENTYLSIKIPLFKKQGDLAGLFGISFKLQDTFSNQSMALINHFGNLSNVLLNSANKFNFNADKEITKREDQVLSYLVLGDAIKDIAKKLFISIRTVESHIESIKSKLNCNRTSQVISIALRSGYGV